MRACVHACMYVHVRLLYARTYASVTCLLPGVHVSMIIRNIMQDEYLYHNYVLKCSLFAGRHPRPEDHWQESDTNGRIERLKYYYVLYYCVYWDIK